MRLQSFLKFSILGIRSSSEPMNWIESCYIALQSYTLLAETACEPISFVTFTSRVRTSLIVSSRFCLPTVYSASSPSVRYRELQISQMIKKHTKKYTLATEVLRLPCITVRVNRDFRTLFQHKAMTLIVTLHRKRSKCAYVQSELCSPSARLRRFINIVLA